MAAQNPPYAMQDQSHGAELFRLATGSPFGAPGVVGANDLAVTATTGMGISVAAGQIWIPGTQGSAAGTPSWETSQGCYYGFNDAALALTVSASDQTNGRIDLVVATVQDSAYSGSVDQWVIQVVTGTPSATPSAPSVPASSLILAEVAVGAGVTSLQSGNITDERQLLQINRPLRGRPAGLIFQGSGTTGTSIAPASMRSASWLVNGMKNSNGGLVVPRAGIYRVVGELSVNVTSSDIPAWLEVSIYQTPAAGGSALTPPGGVGNRTWATTGSVRMDADADALVQCASGDMVQVAGRASSSMANATDQTGGTLCWCSAILEVDLT